MKILSKSGITIMLIIIIALIGSVVIFYSTVWGPWVYSDSTEYIVSARNLIQGHGLGLYGPSGAFHPLSLHPPFYSLVLAFFGLFGADLVTTARWIDIILFGATILVLGLAIYAFTKSAWLSVISSFFLLCMPVVVDVFSGAMSEPLFLFTGLASLCLILLFIKSERIALLLLSGAAAGLSLLTRYSGVAFILTGVCILLIFETKPWKTKFFNVLIYGALSCLPTFVWFIWLRIQSVGARSYPVQINLGEQFTKFKLAAMEVFWSWVPFTSLQPRYSYNLARNILVVVFLMFLALILLAVWKTRKNKQKLLDASNGFIIGIVMFILAAAYLFVLGFSTIFTSPPPDLISRTFLPVQLAVLLAVFSMMIFIIRPWKVARWLYLIPLVFVLGISVSYLHDTAGLVSLYHQEGAGYTGNAWQNAAIFKLVEQLPGNVPLISNESAAVLYFTGRPAYDLSVLSDQTAQSTSPRYGDDPADPTQKVFRENGAALVLFYTLYQQYKELYGDQSNLHLDNLTRDLSLYAHTSDGDIYFYSPAQLP
jgi:4-amino-4-deoxy-L-arabinose transferase-like glycosyltransferase